MENKEKVSYSFGSRTAYGFDVNKINDEPGPNHYLFNPTVTMKNDPGWRIGTSKRNVIKNK